MPELSPQQEKAVRAATPRVIITAGAGSGKTRVLVHRFLTRLEEGIPPRCLVAITFTEKAALELKKRILAEISWKREQAAGKAVARRYWEAVRRDLAEAYISTIHHFCARLLREHPLEAGVVPGFGIVDEITAGQWLKETVQGVLARRWATASPGLLLLIQMQREQGLIEELMRFYQQLRTMGLAPHQLVWGEGEEPQPSFFPEAWERASLMQEEVRHLLTLIDEGYRQRKQEEGMLDFTDLEWGARELLRQGKVKLDFVEVMVDEFQDVNPLQAEILALLQRQAGPSLRWVVVGDPRQSIYGFRGAEASFFDEIAHAAAENEVVPLVENFRSRRGIVEVVNHIFHHLDRDFVPACARRQEEAGPCVEILLGPPTGEGTEADRQAEAHRLAARLSQLVEGGEVFLPDKKENLGYGDIVLLFRTMTHLEPYRQALKAWGIPYRVQGGRGFFQSPEVLDVLNLFRVLEDWDEHRDKVALAGLLRSPFLAASARVLTALLRYEDPWAFLAAKGEGMPPGLREEVARLGSSLLAWRQLRDLLTPGELAKSILRQSHYQERVAVEDPEAVVRLRYLLGYLETLEKRGFSLRQAIDWLETAIELKAGEPLAEEGTGVRLMTVHAAKGLEFPVVVLVETGRWIHQYRDYPFFLLSSQGVAMPVVLPDGRRVELPPYEEGKRLMRAREEEEAKRLLYVGMTRACEYLILSGTYDPSQAGTARAVNSWLGWIMEAVYPEDTLPGLRQEEILPCGGGKIRCRWVEVTPTPPTVAPAREKDEPGASLVPPPSPAATGRVVAISPPAPPPPKVAVTDLVLFHLCPRRYWLERVLHQEAAPPFAAVVEQEVVEQEREGLPPLLRGTLAHRLLQHLAGEEGETIDLIRRLGHEEGLLTPEQKEKGVQELLPLVEHYLASPVYAATRQAVRVWNELPFVFSLPEGTLLGAADRIIQLPTGEAELWDFKTDRVQDPAGVARAVTHYRLQVRAYTLVVTKLLGLRIRRVGLYFLFSGQAWTEEMATEETAQLEKEIRAVLSAYRQARESGIYPSREEECGWCRWKTLCQKIG